MVGGQVEPATPLEGVTEWTNPRNGVHVVRIHYTADPAKRERSWREEAKKGLDRKGWLREYEINFDVPEGEPVFPEYDVSRMFRPCPVLPEARLCRSWDFGHVCPFVAFAQVDGYGRLRFIRELMIPGAPLETMIQAVFGVTLTLMGATTVNCFDAGDPAGEKMTDLGMVRNVLGNHGIVLHTVPSTSEKTEASYAALRTRMLRNVVVPGEGSTPALLVDTHCPIINAALAGALHKSKTPPHKPVDTHPYKDAADTVRYLNANLLGVNSKFMERMQAIARRDAAW
jgi:hypothetical protein